MSLKPEFHFSQSSLQDYIDCQRRFELRYILHREWPALQSEPVIEQEQHMELGHRFHRLVQQHILGLPEPVLDGQARDPDLCRWWQAYRQYNPLSAIAGHHQPEYTLSMPFSGFRLLAKYDLLSVDPGKCALIIDWKTSRKRQKSTFLKKRIQTRLYQFLLVSAGARLNGGIPVLPAQVEMIYWFPEFPDQPERIPYSSSAFQADKDFFTGLVEEIACRADGQFFQTEDEQKCLFCVYRSLCSRGVEAGDWNQGSEDGAEESLLAAAVSGIEINFDQIGEISF